MRRYLHHTFHHYLLIRSATKFTICYILPKAIHSLNRQVIVVVITWQVKLQCAIPAEKVYGPGWLLGRLHYQTLFSNVFS